MSSNGLSDSEVANHLQQGFTVVRGLFADEDLQVILSEVERIWGLQDLVDRKNLRCRFQKHIVSGEYEFDCFDPYFDLSPVLEKYSFNPRLRAIMHSIYGEAGHVCHNQLVFKPPLTEGYSLHQDFVSWPIYPKSFHTVAIALDAHGDDNGCLQMYPGGHLRGLLTPDDGDFHQLTADHVEGLTPTPVHLNPGDAAIFNCLIPHHSDPNRSQDRFRRTLFYCFNADSDGGDFREQYYDYYRNWSRERRKQYGQTDLYFR
ncbi:MAG: phytanoyl-CoA dioxygenase family protein [Planctomycetales bacterium]|nr:phytanoyl-CoA dioxygenase family protein [Planctomycetales bacterium]